MKRSKLNSKERAVFRTMGNDVIDLRYDWSRRLRNALKCIRRSDPEWHAWCKSNLHKGMTRKEMAMVVEIYARTLVTNNYKSLFTENQIQSIIQSNTPFSDSGSLTPC